MKTTRNQSVLLSIVTTLLLGVSTIHAQNAVFTYQGRVSDSGTNFDGTGQFKFALVTSTNAANQATAVAHAPSGGFITLIDVVYGGSGYLTAPVVTISGGGGSGATATAKINGSGVVTNIAVNSPGSGYTSTPTVTVAPPSAQVTYTTYWSNDGTSDNGSEPTAAVNVGVNDGVFTVALGDTNLPNMTPISTSLFSQPNLRLRIWFNDGVNGFAALSPVQNLTPSPYALFANSASNAMAASTATTASTASAVGANAVNSVALQNNAVTASKIASGQVVKSLNGLQDTVTLSAGNNVTITPSGQTLTIAAAGSGWSLTGNSGTTPGVNFIGTSDNEPMEFHVNGSRALRIEPNSSGAPNVIGGSAGNWVAPGTVGATISGGGADNFSGNVSSNSIAGNFGTIGGGWQNLIQAGAYESTIGGGQLNTLEAYYCTIGGGYGNGVAGEGNASTIAGGYGNTNASTYATIGGGNGNSIKSNASDATIAGGSNNSIQQNGAHAAIGGGINNSIQSANGAVVAGGGGNVIHSSAENSTISGGGANSINSSSAYSTIPGGYNNTVGASYSLAAGKYANAANTSSFVWGDGNGGTTSTADQQFMVRCTGGAIFYTASGTSAGAQLYPNATAWSVVSDRNAKKDIRAVNYEDVLHKLARVPVEQWHYKWECKGETLNIGPMAQDFKAAFYPGRDDKSISTLEFDGVELAAIKGLNQKVDQEIKAKDAQIEQLQHTVAQLREMVNKLVARQKTMQQP